MNSVYFKYEFKRLLRNKRFFFFSLVFPLALFLIIGGANKNQNIQYGSTVLPFVLFYMVGMAGYGAMMAAISGGARIAAERSVGWNRQLRLTPLKVPTYFAAKVLSGYFMALISIVLLFVAGLVYGVHVHPGRIAVMVGLILVGLLPFIGLGILLGHLLTVDSMGPALGGGAALLALLGGMWFPVTSGALKTIGELTPSYWIAQADRIGIGQTAWGAQGWTVVAVWTVATALLARWAYRRDTQRV